jgi:F420-non-reducing hydrogenase small subunit
MAAKQKLAIVSLGSCGGCDEAIVDLNEELLRIMSSYEVVFWPLVLDYKYQDIEVLKDNEIKLSIINGHVRNSMQEEVSRLFRRKSQLVLSFGSCACLGGTAGLANFSNKDDILNCVYRDSPSIVNPKNNYPKTKTHIAGKELILPELYERVYALNQIINVDYYLPGCPPPAKLIENAISAVFEEKLPPKGSTLAPHKALCDTCKRNKTKPAKISITDIKRIHEIEISSEVCFLQQGLLCLGLATRGGCEETCIGINIPCRGCFGAVEGIEDSGAKFLSALAALLQAEKDEELEQVTSKLHDLAGYVYRFSLPVSTLNQKHR